MDSSTVPRFACDAMLGGLVRWLRATGYDAFWQLGIDDHELIRLARESGRVLLSSDTRLFDFAVLRDGMQPALFVPLRLSPLEQLAFVLEKMRLTRREPRCMVCGGELGEVPRDQVKDRVPPRTFAWLERFWQCAGCGKVFWHGTHWQRIEKALEQVFSGHQ